MHSVNVMRDFKKVSVLNTLICIGRKNVIKAPMGGLGRMYAFINSVYHWFK